MKLTRTILLCLALGLATRTVAHATTAGFVFCDANHNGQFDSGDQPMPGVLIVVTNTSGTFSNANWTTTPDGGFAIALGSPTDTYVEYIHPDTLPSDATVLQPAGGVYTFTLGPNNTEFTGNFLVSSSTCSNAPPPPPPTTNNFCLHGAGSLCGPDRSRIVFSGTVQPACGSTNGDSGQWDICVRPARLRFQGEVLQIVTSGEAQTDAGASFSYIEFEGAGTLRGIEGCRANYGLVSFYGRAEDHGHCAGTHDELYFRVYGSDGTTLLLISGDQGNPLDVAPVAISLGDIVISTNCCPCSGGGSSGSGGGDEGDHNGEHGQGGCHQGNGGGDHHQGGGEGNGGGNGNSGQGHGSDNGNGHTGNGNGGNCNQGNNGHGQGNQGNHGEGNHGQGNHGGSDQHGHSDGGQGNGNCGNSSSSNQSHGHHG